MPAPASEPSPLTDQPSDVPVPGPVLNRPGWPEIAVGLVAALVAVAAAPLLGRLGLASSPLAYGLLLTAWSGVVGLVGFAAAFLVRIRSWAAFNVRRTTWRWMALGAAAGVVAFAVKGLVNLAVTSVTGLDNPQGAYYDAASSSALSFALTVVFLAVLTPIGEELLFRGVLATALLRYGPWVGVFASSAVFAFAHGVNIAMPSAFVVGVIAAEMMRRSNSLWPAVAVHVLNNLGLPLFVAVGGIITTG